MKVFFSFALIFICALGSCKAQDILHLTDSSYAIIPCKQATPFKKAKEASLSEVEIRQIESIANKGIEEYNKHTKWEKIDLDYKVQLVPVINQKGEKEVWINGFCDDERDWRKIIVSIRDGGNCFFQMKINLSKKKCYDVGINGEA